MTGRRDAEAARGEAGEEAGKVSFTDPPVCRAARTTAYLLHAASNLRRVDTSFLYFWPNLARFRVHLPLQLRREDSHSEPALKQPLPEYCLV